MKNTLIVSLLLLSIGPALAELPAGISENSPAAEVLKLTQANVGVDVITSYINNYTGSFSLTADQILALTDAGVPTSVVNQMLTHDKTISLPSTPIAPSVPSENTYIPTPDTAPVTITTFQDELAPYGTWIYVEGYGQCWQPTVVRYTPDWQPYAVRGHWVYTDYGWFWQSDYAWGTTFHYGRWFLSPQGWCWWPDTVWAPSWVAWRNNGEYCGWAPLPPYTELRVGEGLYYRGNHVSIDFDFGFSVNYFTFVSVNHMGDRNPWQHRVSREDAGQVFHSTHYENHYEAHERTFINHGFNIERIPNKAVEHIHVNEVNQSHHTLNPTINHLDNQEPRLNSLNSGNPRNSGTPSWTAPVVPQSKPESIQRNQAPPQSTTRDNLSPTGTPAHETTKSTWTRPTDTERPVQTPRNTTQTFPNYEQNRSFQGLPPRNPTDVYHQDNRFGSPRGLQNTATDHSNKQDYNGKQ